MSHTAIRLSIERLLKTFLKILLIFSDLIFSTRIYSSPHSLQRLVKLDQILAMHQPGLYWNHFYFVSNRFAEVL